MGILIYIVKSKVNNVRYLYRGINDFKKGYHPRTSYTLLCDQDNKEILRTLSLTGNGLLHNATACSIISDAFQIFPELRGTTQTKMDATILHLPDITPVITDFELQQLADIPPLEIEKLSDIHDKVTASLQTYDVKPRCFKTSEIRSPDRPARSQSLYRLRHPAQYSLNSCY